MSIADLVVTTMRFTHRVQSDAAPNKWTNMGNQMTKLLLAAALGAVLLGCAGSAPRLDAQHIADLKKGETTLQEVVREFGRPSVLLNNPDGTKAARYLHNDAVSASTMIPLLSTEPVDSTTFYFDEHSVLVDYKVVRSSAVAANASGANKESPGIAKAPSPPAGAVPASSAGAKPASPASGSWTLHGLLPEPTTQNR
jgi:hypothetical protein